MQQEIAQLLRPGYLHPQSCLLKVKGSIFIGERESSTNIGLSLNSLYYIVWVQLACWEDTYHVPSQGLCLSGATRDAQKLFLSCVVNELSLWAELNTCLYVLDLEADVGILP
jgi:hypothetical protein